MSRKVEVSSSGLTLPGVLTIVFVVLKLVEGMYEGVLLGILRQLMEAIPDKADTIRQFGRRLHTMYDFNEYGGAPLLGVGGCCLICHGASDACGIKNAVRGAMSLVANHVNEQISDLLSKPQRTVHA